MIKVFITYTDHLLILVLHLEQNVGLQHLIDIVNVLQALWPIIFQQENSVVLLISIINEILFVNYLYIKFRFDLYVQ